MPYEITVRRFTPTTIDRKARSVSAVVATENPVRVFDTQRFEVVDEVLLMAGLELPESGRVPLLDSHDRSSVSKVMGSVGEFKVTAAGLEATITLSTDPESAAAWTKISEGHLKALSVGYSVLDSTWVPPGETTMVAGREFTGPLKITTNWELLEVSLTPIGADRNAQVRSATTTGEHTMTETTTDRKPTGTTDRETTAAIIEACVLTGQISHAPDFIRQGLSIEQVRSELFKQMAATSRPVGPTIEVTRDERETRRSAMVDALATRAGTAPKDPHPAAREYQQASLLDLAKECARAAGMNPNRLDRQDLIRRSFAANSTSDFPYILANAANKVLRTAYELEASTWHSWCTIGSASDFRTMSRVQLSEAPELELVLEGGEYRESPWTESRETFAVQKYGKVFSVTLEAIVNDDLGALTRVPRAFGSEAARRVNQSVYSILTANAAMADGTALFHADHANLAATGAALSEATLTAALLAIRTQTGLNGATLGLRPKTLIVPAAIEVTARKLLNSVSIDSANAGIANPFQNLVSLTVEPLLDASSATAWYLVADQNQIDGVEVAFLDGQQSPYLEEREGFEVDGRQYKVRIVFGCKALDWRGLYMNAGA